jgi:hypothetical protein
MALVINDRVKETSTSTGASTFTLAGAQTGFVTFTSGTKDVFCTLPASKAVYLDSTGSPVGAASAGFAVAMAIAL